MHLFAPLRKTFSGNEAQISQGGLFLPRTAAEWTDVAVTDGVAHGTQIRNEYDDSYALIAGEWGTDYEMEGTVYRDPALNVNATHEIELNVCAVQTNTTIRMVECLFSLYGSVEMYSWAPGAYNDSTRFGTLNSGSYGAHIPDLAKVRIRKVGNTLAAFVQVGQTTVQCAAENNLPYADGQPCLGFFNRPQDGATPRHFGLRDISIRRIPTTYTLRPSGTVPRGVYPFSIAIPRPVRALWLRCPRGASGWLNNNTKQLRLKMEYSVDGGVTWPRGYEITTDGIPSVHGIDPGVTLDFSDFGEAQTVQVRGEVEAYRNLQTSFVLDIL